MEKDAEIVAMDVDLVEMDLDSWIFWVCSFWRWRIWICGCFGFVATAGGMQVEMHLLSDCSTCMKINKKCRLHTAKGP